MGLRCWAWASFLWASMFSMPTDAQPISPARDQAVPDRDHPTLSRRPPPGPLEGKIKLDVVVTDEAGRPVAGLEQKDFTLLDNRKARPILSFRAVDGTVEPARVSRRLRRSCL